MDMVKKVDNDSDNESAVQQASNNKQCKHL